MPGTVHSLVFRELIKLWFQLYLCELSFILILEATCELLLNLFMGTRCEFSSVV